MSTALINSRSAFIKRITKETNIELYLTLDADQTSTIINPELTVQIIEEIDPKNIILAIDVRVEQKIPKPATHGWQTTSDTTLWEVISYYQQIGIRNVLCTDIACDGMMNGPNFNLYKQATERFPNIHWQASGGIRHQEDIENLDSLGIAAAILGLTLYQGNFEKIKIRAARVSKRSQDLLPVITPLRSRL